MIKENYQEVKKDVENVAVTSGRNSEDVTLIAVSKLKPEEDLLEAYEAGARDFGENWVQEMNSKHDNLPEDIRWHMIGHLQTNKVKYIVGWVHLIHSVDSVKLAKEISKESVKKGVTTNILVEVNVAGEESKYGITPETAAENIMEMSKLPNIKIKGLMTVAPFVENQEENREIFKIMKKLSEEIDAKNYNNVSMGVLSMGMSGDYQVAIEEGATMVRVGTKIFGQRDYNK